MSDNHSVQQTIKEVAKETEKDAITSLVSMRSDTKDFNESSVSLATSSKANDNKLHSSGTVSVGDKLIGDPIVPEANIATEIIKANPKKSILETQNTLPMSKTSFMNLATHFEALKSDVPTKNTKCDNVISKHKSNKALKNTVFVPDSDYDNALNSLIDNFLNLTETKYGNGKTKLHQKRVLMQHLVD